MLDNKYANMTPYDMDRHPSKQYPFLLPLIWGGAWLLTRQFNLKIDRSGIKGIKPPYLVIATHQGFSDYYIGPLAMFPRRAMYVSDMEGFAGFGNWLYRGLGCIPKRRYVSDLAVVRNIQYGLSMGQSVFVYPESRHSNVGTTAYIPKNLGKLAKMMKVPVVVLSAKGSYLANPFWDEEHTRKLPMRAKLSCICDAKELQTIRPEVLQERIEQALTYDEYRYQQEEKILITAPKRAEGLQKALYQCIKCGKSHQMTSAGSRLSCTACGAVWELTEDGWLAPLGQEGTDLLHIPNWYEWERKEAIRNLKDFPYVFDVRVEALPNEYGFVKKGEGVLTLTEENFVLSIGANCDFAQNVTDDSKLIFPHRNRESVQTEYNYRGRGSCIVLSTRDCCYYIYSKNPETELQQGFSPTWFQFVGEYLFSKASESAGK